MFLLVAGALADAQPASKRFRIGWLSVSSDGGRGIADFQQGLHDLRYVEGRDVAIENRHAPGNLSALAEIAADFARQPVDIIITSGETSALAAKRITKTIPIVAIELAWDPVKAGLVTSLARPEGNLTGLDTQSDELWPKRLELLRELAPNARRLAVLWNPDNQGNASCVAEINSGAARFDMEVRSFEARDAASLDRAFAMLGAASLDAVAICWDSATLAHARAIAEFALKQRLPTVSALREYVDAGALLSYGPSLATQRRRAAYLVDRILKGAKPADLPVERPTHFDLVVNETTAKGLRIALPPAIVGRAEDVVR